MNILIHADWLEEQGLSDRANFIRSCDDEEDDSVPCIYFRYWTRSKSKSSFNYRSESRSGSSTNSCPGSWSGSSSNG